MLPLLFFEMVWKAIWLARIGLPMWLAHRMDRATADTFSDVIPIVLFPLLIPWSYVLQQFARKRGDPWLRRAPPAAVPAES